MINVGLHISNWDSSPGKLGRPFFVADPQAINRRPVEDLQYMLRRMGTRTIRMVSPRIMVDAPIEALIGMHYPAGPLARSVSLLTGQSAC